MQLKVRSTPYLRAHLTNDSAALQLKARGRATLNSTGNELSASWFSILGAFFESSEKPFAKI